MQALVEYFWRLLPANPIMLRVVAMASMRKRDLFIRCGYLGLLIVVVLITLLGQSDLANMSLIDLATTSGDLFQTLSFMQLGLVALLAPIFTAGAITQEKDSQTYDILLATPLSNGQIVLGTLLSRIFFIISLLLSAVPVFFLITQLFGGVAISSIILSFAISAATAFITGAIAMAIATFKVGTRRTIFSFYLFIVAYLAGLYMADNLAFFRVILADGTLSDTSVLTGLHPFLAMKSVFFDPAYTPPTIDQLPPFWQTWPLSTLMTSPSTFYVELMFTLSAVLVLPSIVLLRKMAQSSSTIWGWIRPKLHLGHVNQNRKPRIVWTNPIAWREAKTRASAARASLMRYGFMGAGLLGAIALLIGYCSTESAPTWINNGYDSDHGTLSIIQESEGIPLTVKVTSQSALSYMGKQIRTNDLRGVYKVDNFNISPDKKILVSINLSPIQRKVTMTNARVILGGMILVEIAVILLIVTNAAASTVTREREDGSLDLLLATPITSRYYIWGKLRGLVSFVIPLIMIPAASCAMFVLHDIFQGSSSTPQDANPWIMLPESIFIIPLMLVGVTALASLIGMHLSLRLRKTTLAVMISIVIVGGLCAALSACGYGMLNGSESTLGVAIAAFSPFTLVQLLSDPENFASRFLFNNSMADLRTILITLWVIATALNVLWIWLLYRSMVKNFDMTIRRQAR